MFLQVILRFHLKIFLNAYNLHYVGLFKCLYDFHGILSPDKNVIHIRMSNWESEYSRFFSIILPIMTKGLVLKGVQGPLVIRGAPHSLIWYHERVSNWEIEYARFFSNVLPIKTKGLWLKGV
jgi:hypothetical protein